MEIIVNEYYRLLDNNAIIYIKTICKTTQTIVYRVVHYPGVGIKGHGLFGFYRLPKMEHLPQFKKSKACRKRSKRLVSLKL